MALRIGILGSLALVVEASPAGVCEDHSLRVQVVEASPSGVCDDHSLRVRVVGASPLFCSADPIRH
jgi:hypothetical protein